MVELGADNYKAMSEFQNMKICSGIKPCLLFNGSNWDLNPELKRLKSLFTDFFQREKVKIYLYYCSSINSSIHVKHLKSNIFSIKIYRNLFFVFRLNQ